MHQYFLSRCSQKHYTFHYYTFRIVRQHKWIPVSDVTECLLKWPMLKVRQKINGHEHILSQMEISSDEHSLSVYVIFCLLKTLIVMSDLLLPAYIYNLRLNKNISHVFCWKIIWRIQKQEVSSCLAQQKLCIFNGVISFLSFTTFYLNESKGFQTSDWLAKVLRCNCQLM